MKTTLIASLLITNVLTLLLLKQEREWSNMLMHTKGVEKLVYSDEYEVVLKQPESTREEMLRGNDLD